MQIKMIRTLLLLCLYTFANATTNDYSLEVMLNKNNIYLGESVRMTLKFSYKNAEDYALKEVKIANIEVKELDFFDYKENNSTFVEKTNYLLTPQKSGLFKIGDFIIDVESLTKEYKNFDNKSKYIQKFSIHSDTLKLEVQKLPQNVLVIGEYTLTASIDKQNIAVGEVVTLTVSLQGKGNVKDLDSIDLQIPNATSYLVMSAKNRNENLLSKTFEIIADESYTIAPFELHYFDKTLGIVRTTKSQAFSLKVENSQKHQVKSSSLSGINENVYTFAIGFFSNLLLVVIYFIYKKIPIKEKKNNFLTSLKHTKSQNELYKKLVTRLGRNKELDKLIYSLESKDTTHYKQNKKLVLKLVKKHFKVD